MTPPIVKQLGPPVEVNVKLRLPEAFLEYIQEEIKIGEYKDVNDYCTYNVVQVMTSLLDGSEKIVLPKHTIPRAIAYRGKEIIKAYVESYGD